MEINKYRLFFKYIFVIILVSTIILNYLPLLRINEFVKEINHSTNLRFDYIYHFTYYAALTFSFVVWKCRYITIKNLIIPLILFLLFAIINEYLQIYVPNRAYNPFDMLANSTGALSGIIVSYIILPKNKTV